MRPYLAILKDSFREAIASRVLLIALAAIVVVLLLLSPFGLRYETATELRRSEVTRPKRVLERLLTAPEAEAAGHVRSLLTEERLSAMEQLATPQGGTQFRRGPGSPVQRQLVNQLNELLDHEAFYSVAAWEPSDLPEEAQQLISQSSLTETETRRRNLLLLIAAFPRDIRVTDSQAISLYYANVDVIESMPLTPSQLDPVVTFALTLIITLFLGFFGIFASLLVTAGLIPRTFEPGEIALLLSKPVNRSLLFFARFLGGCVFTTLYAGTLVAGLWLLLGIRMGIWRTELLWCIPVYVFLFMVYFSVSAVAGLIWRNSIVALCVVVVFWFGITAVQVARDGIEDYIFKSRGIREITLAGDHMIAADGNRRTYQWDDADHAWSEIFQPPRNRQAGHFTQQLRDSVRFRPAYDEHQNRLLALEQTRSRFGGRGAPELLVGYDDDDWERVSLGTLPDAAETMLFAGDGRMLLPTRSALYEFVDDPAEGSDGGGSLIGNIAGLFGSRSKNFRRVAVDQYPDLGRDFSCDLNPVNDSLLFFSDGRLSLFGPTSGGTYEQLAARDFDAELKGVLAIAGNSAVVALSDGRVLMLDAATLESTSEMQLGEGVLPRVCAAAGDGSTFAVLTHEKTLVLFRDGESNPHTWSPPENGTCAAVSFSPEGRLLVSDGRLAVREYDVETQEMTREWAESETWLYGFYDFIVQPVQVLLPRPSQLDNFVPYVMTGDRTMVSGEQGLGAILGEQESLQRDRQVFDVQRAIWENGLFVVGMLLLGCVIITRRDF